jgi:VTC domain
VSHGAAESAADASGSGARPAEAAPEGDAERATAHDSAVTLDRDELKYLIPGPQLAGFVRALRAELEPHRFTGEGANRLPEAQHFTTTVYFDTPSRALLRAARAEPERNVKLRARTYYDVHSSLAELATDPAQIVRHQPWLFLELKRRAGTRTSKHRLRLARAELAGFFSTDLAESTAGVESAPDALERAAVRAFCAALGEPLMPSCAVNYRRVALEDASGALRVTLDLELAYYAPPADLWTRTAPLSRENLGTSRGAAPACLLEVKLRAEPPAWLTRALDRAQAKRQSLSKFVLASEAVHGRD